MKEDRTACMADGAESRNVSVGSRWAGLDLGERGRKSGPSAAWGLECCASGEAAVALVGGGMAACPS